MKIYLASSWRNERQPAVLEQLRSFGHEVYDFRNPAPGDHGFSWRQCTDGPINTCKALRDVLTHPIAIHGFENDFAAMQWADACVLLLPCGNSAHLEAGWFAGQGKPVAVLVPELREPELMYKCFDDARGLTPLFDDVYALLCHLNGEREQRRCGDPSVWKGCARAKGHEGGHSTYDIDKDMVR